jgi:hypothetical protein
MAPIERQHGSRHATSSRESGDFVPLLPLHVRNTSINRNIWAGDSNNDEDSPDNQQYTEEEERAGLITGRRISLPEHGFEQKYDDRVERLVHRQSESANGRQYSLQVEIEMTLENRRYHYSQNQAMISTRGILVGQWIRLTPKNLKRSWRIHLTKKFERLCRM